LVVAAEIYANCFEVFWNRHGEWTPTTYQAVRVTAASAEDARRKVIAALGREPDDVRACAPRAP
jgi:hypothetical protein